MIAERPLQYDKSVENDLFAGLSFPEVPSAPIEVPAPRPNESITKNALVQDSKAYPIDGITLTDVALDVQSTQIEPVARKTNLSSLYATEVLAPHSGNLYPTLPSFAQSRDIEDDAEESSSLLPRNTAYSTSGGSHAINSGVVGSAPTAEQYAINRGEQPHHQEQHQLQQPELITDLVTENSRLADEVANLRRMLGDQRLATANPVSAGEYSSYSQSHPLPQSSALSPAQNASVTGVQISDTTRPPEKGVKYVCCGGCRQWLMAPREAQFVVCSTCDSINNCNLAPKDNTEVHNRENEQRAFAQRNANQAANSFWFLDCLSKGFT